MDESGPAGFNRFNDDISAPPAAPNPSSIIAPPGPSAISEEQPSFSPPSPPDITVSGSEGGNWNIDSEHPLPVAEVYSTYGMEYIIMFISLAVAAFSFGSLLDSVIDLAFKQSGNFISGLFDPYSEAALIVSFPIFAFLFLRLEAKEGSNPSLLNDSSRRRSMQIALVVSFIAGLVILSTYLGTLLSSTNAGDALNSYSYSYSSSGDTPAGVEFLKAIVNVAIAGSIFGYYWYKLHKKTGRE